MSFPPHTRGWTLSDRGRQPGHVVSPAHAGMDRMLRWTRARGIGFPPHTRGWTVTHPWGTESVAVSPAHAGMDRPCRCTGLPYRRFPRTRGDGPQIVEIGELALRFPPQTRGWTPRRRHQDQRSGVSPAHAGMDRGRDLLRHWHQRFPRTRGDGPVAEGILLDWLGFPPHTRGWTQSSDGFDRS